MYIPTSFDIKDSDIIETFMREHDFATVVSHSAQSGIVASHVPVIVRRVDGELRVSGHLARANRHWPLMDGQAESMLIFHGPDGYVSPSWYAAPRDSVPTWNYAVVHAYGRPAANHDAGFLDGVLNDLAARYEGGREPAWSATAMSAGKYEKLRRAIVGFEMVVTRCQATFKLGQNRSEADRRAVVAGLEREGTSAASALADFMKEHAGI